jgi:hypothetical protein
MKQTYHIELETIKGSLECIGKIRKDENYYFDCNELWLHVGNTKVRISDSKMINEVDYQIGKEMDLCEDYNNLLEINNLQ